MKKILFSIFLAAALLSSCKTNTISDSGNGVLDFTLKTDGTYIVKSETNVDVNNFIVNITKDQDTKFNKEWLYSEMPATVELAPGGYNVTATNIKEPALVAWDQPIYLASKDMQIIAGKVSPISLTCSIVNMKVSVECSDKFLSELTTFTITINSEDGALTWSKEEVLAGKAGYFSVKDLTIKVSGYRAIDGSEAHLTHYITDVEPKDHHIIKLDARVTGDAGITLDVDTTTNDKETNIEVPGFEDVPVEGGDDNTGGQNPPASTAPTISWPSNPTFGVTELKQSGMDVNLTILAPKKIKEFKVVVNSPALNSTIAAMTSDGTTTMDLINDASLIEMLVETGLPTGNQLYNQTSVDFSLGGLLPLIFIYNPEVGSEHKFTLKIEDFENQTLEKEVSFVYSGN